MVRWRLHFEIMSRLRLHPRRNPQIEFIFSQEATDAMRKDFYAHDLKLQ